MTPFPKGGSNERDDSDGQEGDDEVALEPVFGLAAVEDHFQASESESNEKNAEAVDFEAATFASGCDFASEFRRVGNKALGQNERDDADGNIDEENPAPTPIVGDPSTEGRANGRGGYDGHCVESESGGPRCGRERGGEGGLVRRGGGRT